MSGAIRTPTWTRFDNFYKQAQVKVTGKQAGSWITRTGQSCSYGITLIESAPNKDRAVLFLEYLLSPDGGLKILKEMGQPTFSPCKVPDAEMLKRLPPSLQSKAEVRS